MQAEEQFILIPKDSGTYSYREAAFLLPLFSSSIANFQIASPSFLFRPFWLLGLSLYDDEDADNQK